MKKKILLCLLVIVILFTITGCGEEKSKKTTTKTNETTTTKYTGENNFIGIWQVSAYEKNKGQVVKGSEIEDMNNKGQAIFLILKEDGTALNVEMGVSMDGTYKVNSEKEALLSIVGSGYENTAKLDKSEYGDMKTVTVAGSKYYFKKIDNATYEAYKAKFSYDE